MIKNKPAISVIIPVYNAEKYLRRCLNSVLNQTFADWQAVCINDGSPDNCAEILDEYAKKDSRFKIISQENAGVSVARNVGLSAATGQYLVFIDSDDFVHPQMFELLNDLAVKNNSDIVSFKKDSGLRARLVIKQFLGQNIDNVIPLNINKKYNIKKIKYITVSDVFPYVTESSKRKKKFQIKHTYLWQNMFKTDFVKGLEFVPNIILEDALWWSLLLLRHPKTTITNLPLYYYIPQKFSLMSSTKQKQMFGFLTFVAGTVFAAYKEKATLRERNIWQTEFVWVFLGYAISKANRFKDAPDIQYAKDTFLKLKNQGVLDVAESKKCKKIQTKIYDFINDKNV